MPCEPFALPGGTTGIICSRTRRQRCKCGRAATLLCDWKRPDRKSGTCDAPICSHCTTSPAPGKDLCHDHAAQWHAWQLRNAARQSAPHERSAS